MSETGPSQQTNDGQPPPIISRALRSDAVLLAASSLVAYMFVFLYEAGLCARYDVPLELITLNLTSGLIVALALSSLFAYWVYNNVPIFNLVFRERTDEQYDDVGRRLAAIAPAAALLVGTVNLIALVVFCVTLYKTGPWLARKYWNWLTSGKHPVTPIVTLDMRIPPRSRFIAALMILGLAVSYAAGRTAAGYSPHYEVVRDKVHYAVVRVYGDQVITKPFRIETRDLWLLWVHNKAEVLVVERGLRVFKLGDKETPEFGGLAKTYTVLFPSRSTDAGFMRWLFPYL